MKAAEIVTAMRRRYGCEGDDGIGPEWAALDEMQMHGAASSRIDLLCVRAWSGKPKGHERHAVEVKVSRGDLKREIESGKWRPWATVTHRFYLACPAGLNLDGLEIPDSWGIVRVDARGTSEERRAERRDPEPLPERTWIEAFRRASRTEARIRDADVDDPAARIADLERQVVSAHRTVETARQAEERWEDRARDALNLYAGVAPEAYCRCGTRVKLAKRPVGRGGIRWEHDGEPGVAPFSARRGGNAPCRYVAPDIDRLAETLAEREVA